MALSFVLINIENGLFKVSDTFMPKLASPNLSPSFFPLRIIRNNFNTGFTDQSTDPADSSGCKSLPDPSSSSARVT